MATELTREPGASLHHQIFSVLRSSILSGRYATSSLLPGESTMMDMFGVSRATVRRALQTLESDGMIERRQGKGTRVVYEPPKSVDLGVEQHIHEIDQLASRTDVTLIEFEWINPPISVQRALDLPDGAQTLKIVRLRSALGRPLRYLVNYIPRLLGEQMRRNQFDNVTLFAVLRSLGRTPTQFDDEVGAVLADPVLAKALDVRIGSPLVELSRTMFDGDVPIAFQWTVIPPDRGKLRTSIIHPA